MVFVEDNPLYKVFDATYWYVLGKSDDCVATAKLFNDIMVVMEYKTNKFVPSKINEFGT